MNCDTEWAKPFTITIYSPFIFTTKSEKKQKLILAADLSYMLRLLQEPRPSHNLESENQIVSQIWQREEWGLVTSGKVKGSKF